MTVMQVPDPALAAALSPPSFGEAVRFWLKLGFISFGGPAGQIAIMHQELVERRRWISDRRFLHALNYCMVLPGPEAQQLATYLGWLMHRTWGGIVAGALFVLPSLLILMALSYVYLRYGDVVWVRGVFDGIKPAVVAIVAFAGWRIGSRVLKHPLLMLIAVAALLGMARLRLPFPLVILGAGLLGWIGGKILPAAFRQGQAHAIQANAPIKAWIDDNTPPPRHAEVRWRHAATVMLAAIALWAAGYLLVEQPTLRAMAAFFSQAALLTFGGAYAVLPYVYESAVQTHGWLTAAQMIDGLALGETTPGPLIMVVAFVGFVGAWAHQVFGPDQLLLAGVLGACVATYFTFLPSFLFILLGGPWVERSRDDVRLTAPLTAITAAVVGVIVNLAVLFAWHVLWPEAHADAPFAGRFAWVELLVMIAAFVALWRFKQGVLPVVGVCALVGLLRAWVG